MARKVTQELYHLGNMILVFTIRTGLFGVEEVLPGQKFEYLPD
jgi:hypothetical protein